MIKNERQYRITKAEAERFEQVLAKLTVGAVRQGQLHPRMAQAEREAIESQLNDLLQEIKEYEDLKFGKISVIRLDSFDQLPEGLVRARIAAGLSQKALAQRLGLKEQQIQRYEAEGFMSASFQRLSEIANALGVKIREEIELPTQEGSFDQLIRRLGEAGVDREFLMTRIVPLRISTQVESGDFEDDANTLLNGMAAPVERIYGWRLGELFGQAPLASPRAAAASARFKMPAKRRSEATGAYATYAHYLALVVIDATEELPRERIPLDPAVLRHSIIEGYGALTLETATRYCWDLGVPVLPLRDRGTFHGACWRYRGRNVIVLKQQSRYQSRWLVDLIHELRHAGQDPEAEEFEVIEADETSEERRNSDEENEASQFAGDVVLDGRAEELAEKSVRCAQGKLQFLRNATLRVAQEENIPVGLLANYLAYRLSRQGENWWGAAANLQEVTDDPWRVVRDVFLQRFPFGEIAEADRTLLQQALA